MPARFAPAAPGGTSGTISFAAAGRDRPASVPLIADGTRAGLYATVPRLALRLSLNDGTEVGPVPVGQPVYAVTTVVNGGAAAQRITRVSAPGTPFAVRGLPRPGTMLRPGQSVTVQVGYTPRRVVSSKAALAIAGSSGTIARIPLSGVAQPAHSKFTAPPRIGFGDVRLRHTTTRFIHIVNAGNETAIMTGTRLTGPFRAPYRVEDGLPVNGGYDFEIPVTFTPARAGHVTGSFRLSWKDEAGTDALTVPITATGVR